MANSTDSGFSKEAPTPHSQTKHEYAESAMDPITHSSSEQAVPSITTLLKGKEREWEAVAVKSKMGPLHLLDLPVDILRLIIKEITHTNDLTSLVLTNSTLYNLSVPHIYARFDIVWPEAQMATSEKSVDALTYGLTTLCLGSKFAQRTRWLRGNSATNPMPSQRLVENQYAKYTRKFSLGNGPTDWVADYNITKEAGKMLGTLVALAVAKMVNLETFIWDMPTGVLSDVFMSLASLPDHYPDDGQSKLEKVWIRWHDNADIGGTASSAASSPALPLVVPPASNLGTISMSTTNHMTPILALPRYSDSHVEYPTFSILPPLKSLTVLDIDELAYLDEMAVLIERSKGTLQELRVGISQKALAHDFVNDWDGDNLQQVDLDARWPGESRIGERRLGGVLGVLVGRVYEIRRKGKSKSKRGESPSSTLSTEQGSSFILPAVVNYSHDEGIANGLSKLQGTEPIFSQRASASKPKQNGKNPYGSCQGRKRLDGKLRLQTLELEKITLSMQVCCKAFDWAVLTNLTILDCVHHETLWKVLKRQFQPTMPPYGSPSGTPTQYHMGLKKLHTDITTHSLINFIKETLAPNTLEVLFLQDRRRSTPPVVTIDQIFKGAVKKHRSSLKKLLIDSTDKLGRASGPEGSRWRHWVLKTEMVEYITSGRMSGLKELAVAVHYNDWHSFLQRLPSIPQLRSLYLPHIQEHSATFDPKELALQLIDIITLRPEIQLCYVGIGSKCFEILETRPDTRDQFGMNGQHHDNTGAISVVDVDEDEDDEEEEEEVDNENSDADEETEDDDDGIDAGVPTDGEDDSTEVSDDAESVDSFEEAESNQSAPKLRLREILFYDDKVAIFKARHGKL